jgi:hypothetical protein
MAWVWCEQAHLGTNQKPIKHYGKGSQISLMISKEAQAHFSWNLSRKGEVMSQMPMLWNSFTLMFIHDL